MIVIDIPAYHSLNDTANNPDAQTQFKTWLRGLGVDLAVDKVVEVSIDPAFDWLNVLAYATNDRGHIVVDPATRQPVTFSARRPIHWDEDNPIPDWLYTFPITSTMSFDNAEGVTYHMPTITCPNDRLTLRIKANPIPGFEPADLPQWGVADESIVKFSSATPDQLTVLFLVTGKLGQTTITCTYHDINDTKICLTADVYVFDSHNVALGHLTADDPAATVYT